jgi:hypothetical protein
MKRQQLGKIRGGLRALRWPLGVLGAAGAPIIAAGLWSAPAQAQFDDVIAEFEEIQFGSDLFNFETWDGNGRTCGTCHRRQDQYNVYPETIEHMSSAEVDLLCAVDVQIS